MTQVPWKLLQDWAKSENKDEFDTQKSVVGTFFLQQDEEGYQNSISDLTKLIAESDFKLIGFRKLPVEPKVLGQMARDNSPTIFQAIMEAKDLPEDMINVKSFVLRKTLQK
jgi:glutamate synthase (ferredoxin)